MGRMGSFRLQVPLISWQYPVTRASAHRCARWHNNLPVADRWVQRYDANHGHNTAPGTHEPGGGTLDASCIPAMCKQLQLPESVASPHVLQILVHCEKACCHESFATV